jgi:hypothetical protein
MKLLITLIIFVVVGFLILNMPSIPKYMLLVKELLTISLIGSFVIYMTRLIEKKTNDYEKRQ